MASIDVLILMQQQVAVRVSSQSAMLPARFADKPGLPNCIARASGRFPVRHG